MMNTSTFTGHKVSRTIATTLSVSSVHSKQSPRCFFRYLLACLENQVIVPSLHDHCLSLSNDVIIIVYVNDMLVYGHDEASINPIVDRMTNEEEVKIPCEGTAEGYLGVDIKRNWNKTTLTQSGLVKLAIEALGLYSKYSIVTSTPVKCAALPRDSGGEPAAGKFNYSAVVGMLLYLTGHIQPDSMYWDLPGIARMKCLSTKELENIMCYIVLVYFW